MKQSKNGTRREEDQYRYLMASSGIGTSQLKIKKRIYNTIPKNKITYGSGVWSMKQTTEKKLRATEKDFSRRAARRSRRERVTNERISEIMGLTHIITNDIKNKQLIWFGHVQRMKAQRIPKQVLDSQPSGMRRPGRPRRSIDEEIEEVSACIFQMTLRLFIAFLY